MKIFINEKGYVASPYIQDATKEIEVDNSIGEKTKTLSFYHVGKYTGTDFILESLLDDDSLRSRRQKECFNIIDRSRLGYDSLTEDQYKELQEGYKAGLKVTETKVIPTKPSWL